MWHCCRAGASCESLCTSRNVSTRLLSVLACRLVRVRAVQLLRRCMVDGESQQGEFLLSMLGRRVAVL